MAKLLTKVWKTATGVFYETQKEALEHERREAISKAMEEAWKDCVAEELDRHKARVTELKGRDWPYSAANLAAPSFTRPVGFLKAMTDKLIEGGFIHEIQTED